MKLLNSILLVLCCVLISCKKDKKETVSNPVGYWQGLFGNGNNTPSFDFAILFRNDGTLRLYWTATDTATAPKAEGIYTVNGTTINSTYTYFSGLTGTFSSVATVNSADNQMTGTYGMNSSVSGEGNFVLTR